MAHLALLRVAMPTCGVRPTGAARVRQRMAPAEAVSDDDSLPPDLAPKGDEVPDKRDSMTDDTLDLTGLRDGK